MFTVLTYIHQHIHEPLVAEDIAKAEKFLSER